MYLLTFVTRTCKRSDMLQRNKESLLMQTDSDWEQVILMDDIGRGLHYANGMLAANKDKVKGRYVYIFDDDHRLIVPDFVAGIRSIVEAKAPDVIMAKAHIRIHGVLPNPWAVRPLWTHVDTGNFVVTNEMWQAHIEAFDRPQYGDFYFIDRVFSQPELSVEWWDYIVAEDMRRE